MSFSHFNLSAPLERALLENGYRQPTPIQEKVIEPIRSGLDVMAKAQTGSGKSMGFALPVLERLMQERREGKAKIRTLVLTPTRELTLQVARTFDMLGAFFSMPPKVVSIIGGESIGDQLYAIQQGCDIVVATSGRFLDVLGKKQMNLSHLEFFILDEADKMLDLGFAEELDLLLEALPKTRQNLLFSATYPPKMTEIASRITENPVKVSIEQEAPTVGTVTQRVIEVNRENRGPLLRHLLQNEPWEQVLVFMSGKRAADNIAMKFRKYGFSADSFHGDLLQEARNETLARFREKKIRVLFATDIAARGLDIEAISCVVNFDLPRAPGDYIHRIGRTARAGKSGIALSMIDYADFDHFALIEKRSHIKLPREQIEGFELTGTPPVKERGQAPVKGKGKSKKDKAREKAAREAQQRA